MYMCAFSLHLYNLFNISVQVKEVKNNTFIIDASYGCRVVLIGIFMVSVCVIYLRAVEAETSNQLHTTLRTLIEAE